MEKREQDETTVVKAGPLPADATQASCQFEWALHVRSKTEKEMIRFVATLRQSVRLSQYIQGQKADEYKQRFEGQVTNEPVRKQRTGGQLEVVLVEARRLEPAILNSVHKLS